MKLIVLYATKGGNTQKVAEQIANQLGCRAIRINKQNPTVDLAGYDLVFVGTGIY